MARVKNGSYAYNLGYAQCRDSDCPSGLINPFDQMIESELYYDWIEGNDDAWYDYHQEAL